ncbi:MAG: V-type ATP synthase subunit D [Clostridia bacterium]|nr:V-type ATP synthase subunit D [Clostridia bacterium]
MAEIRVNPTRMEMKKLRERYNTARRGHKLLKDKRDELMRRFLDLVREDKELRRRVEERLHSAYASFSVASAVSSPEMLREALIVPKNEISMGVSYKNLMSVSVPSFDFSVSDRGSGINYGMAFSSGELDSAVSELSELTEDLIRMAELEKSAQLLAEEIEKTRRRVNALEYIMMPRYLEGIKSIKMKLEENERGNLTRLMKVKDMMIEKTLAKSEDDEDETEW